MALEVYQNLLSEVSALTGVEGLAGDADGYVALSFDDLVLHLQYDADAGDVVLFTKLQEVEGDRAEQIYLMLLGANMFWQGTQGGTFSVEPASGSVFLLDRRGLVTLRAEGMIAWIEGFKAVASHWRERIDTANRGGPISDPDLPASAGGFGTGGPSGGASENFIRV